MFFFLDTVKCKKKTGKQLQFILHDISRTFIIEETKRNEIKNIIAYFLWPSSCLCIVRIIHLFVWLLISHKSMKKDRAVEPVIWNIATKDWGDYNKLSSSTLMQFYVHGFLCSGLFSVLRLIYVSCGVSR